LKKTRRHSPPRKSASRHSSPSTNDIAEEDLDAAEVTYCQPINNQALVCHAISPHSLTQDARPWQFFPVRDPFFDFFDDEEHQLETPPSSDASADGSSYLEQLEPSFLLSPAPIPDPDIDASDMAYFGYFLSDMVNVLPYVKIFPSTVASIFSSSIHHPALRHSVLSIAALCCSRKFGQGKQRALEHLSKSLKLLQQSLWSVEVNECVANAIFLLAYFNLLAGDKASARKHLHGLSMVLDQIQQDHLVKNPGLLSSYAISPLTMLVWRMAIRVDFIIAITGGQRPVFPMYPLLFAY